MLWRVLRSKNISAKTKMHGILHLLNSTMFLNVLIVGVLSIPMLYIKNEYAHLKPYFYVMSFFVISTIIFFICYWSMYRRTYGSSAKNFIQYIILFTLPNCCICKKSVMPLVVARQMSVGT